MNYRIGLYLVVNPYSAVYYYLFLAFDSYLFLDFGCYLLRRACVF